MIAESQTKIIREDIRQILDEPLPWNELAGSRVLVTGASGMLPMYCVKTLLELNTRKDLGLHVSALVRNPRRAAAVFGTQLDRDDIDLISGDVTDPSVDLPPFDHLIHGASAARPTEHTRSPVDTIRANLIGTDLLLSRHVKQEKPGTFLLMSSSEVYGKQQADLVAIDEGSYGGIDLLSPRSSYSEGKRAAETLVAAYAHQEEFEFRNLRFAHIYGPGMRLDDGRVQADFARDALKGRAIALQSAGLAMRSYTYVADAIRGLFTAWVKGENGAYNIGDEKGTVSIRELAGIFAKQARPAPVAVSHVDASVSQSFNPELFLGLNSGKIQKLGWFPKTRLSVGTGRMVRHLEEIHG